MGAIEPHVPVFDKSAREDGTFFCDDFAYDPEIDIYLCPVGEILTRCILRLASECTADEILCTGADRTRRTRPRRRRALSLIQSRYRLKMSR